MSIFEEEMESAHDIIYEEMGDLCEITTSQGTKSCLVIFDMDVLVQDENFVRKVDYAYIRKSDVIFESKMRIKRGNKTYQADNLHSGDNFETDQYEWAITIREIK